MALQCVGLSPPVQSFPGKLAGPGISSMSAHSARCPVPAQGALTPPLQKTPSGNRYQWGSRPAPEASRTTRKSAETQKPSLHSQICICLALLRLEGPRKMEMAVPSLDFLCRQRIRLQICIYELVALFVGFGRKSMGFRNLKKTICSIIGKDVYICTPQVSEFLTWRGSRRPATGNRGGEDHWVVRKAE